MKQITTGTSAIWKPPWCEKALEGLESQPLDFLFIENVGNLVCPASYDLGEDLRLVLLSVTEGEDKPLKYPTIFNSADVAIVTKSDLAEAVEFDGKRQRQYSGSAAGHARISAFSEDRRKAWKISGVPCRSDHRLRQSCRMNDNRGLCQIRSGILVFAMHPPDFIGLKGSELS